MEQETKRKIIHISMGFLALLLIIFPRWLALIFVLIALGFILVIARPSVWKSGFDAMASREEDQRSGLLHGPTLYIIMVLILILFFDMRIAGAVFAIMAFGDGFANVIGTRFGKHRYPTFENKSFEGLIAFIFFAFISSSLAFLLISVNPDYASWIQLLNIKEPTEISSLNVFSICFIVSTIAGLIELTSSRILNDNITVPIISGFLMTLLLNF